MYNLHVKKIGIHRVCQRSPIDCNGIFNPKPKHKYATVTLPINGISIKSIVSTVITSHAACFVDLYIRPL